MSNECGCGSNIKFDGSTPEYKRILKIIIVINFTMFIVELGGGILSGSMALLADCLDFLGDSVTYTISFIVIGMPLSVRAKAGLFKGISLLFIAAWVLGATGYRILVEAIPEALTMGTIGFVALGANVVSAALLLRFKDGDSNVRSVWLCSRNDAFGNVAVILAASGIFVTDSGWPDLLVAGVMASLFSYSAFQIIRQSLSELQNKN